MLSNVTEVPFIHEERLAGSKHGENVIGLVFIVLAITPYEGSQIKSL